MAHLYPQDLQRSVDVDKSNDRKSRKGITKLATRNKLKERKRGNQMKGKKEEEKQ
jgi:hypothetical protein